jgi:hypothetical protein
LYKVILVLGLGLLIFVAPVARADVALWVHFNWDDNFSKINWGTVTDTYPLQDWLLPAIQRQSSSELWTVDPIDYSLDGSVWNTHWAITGIVGNSGHNIDSDLGTHAKTPTELKLGNTIVTNMIDKQIIVDWAYDGNTAMSADALTNSLQLIGYDALGNPVTPTYLGALAQIFVATPPRGAHNGYIQEVWDFTTPVAWEDFKWSFASTSDDHLHNVNVQTDITGIPEPGTLALLTLAIPFVGMIRRRRVA